jgi:dual specificity phosphatase 3
MSLVWPDPSPDAPDIYVGGMQAAADINGLRKHGIGCVLNCAINADIDCVQTPYDPDAPEYLNNYGYAPIRYYKLGLVDGPGNPPEMMLAGYYLLCGITRQTMPDKPSYPNQKRGHVLINCRAGRSRSIIMASLYLHLQKTERFKTLSEALLFVRKAREIRLGEYHDAPNNDMIEAAERAAALIAGIMAGT